MDTITDNAILIDHGGGEVECLLQCDPSWDWSQWFAVSEPYRTDILTEEVSTNSMTYRRMTGNRISERRRYLVTGGEIFLSVGIWTRAEYRRNLEDAVMERDGLPPLKRNRKKQKSRRWNWDRIGREDDPQLLKDVLI